MPGIIDRLRTLTGSSQLSLSFPHIVLAVQQSATTNRIYVLVAKLGNPDDLQEVTEFVTYQLINRSYREDHVDRPDSRECTDGSYVLVRDGTAIFKAIETFRARLGSP